MTVEESYAYCRKLTLKHYENFPVASVLLYPSVRKHVFAIYAFARTADDLADESNDKQKALDTLLLLQNMLKGNEKPDVELFPFLPALFTTLKETSLPVEFPEKLLKAFIYDVDHSYFKTWDELFAYCENSAQPVGHIILWLHNRYKEPYISKSNAITTALQMANFWQDISVDHQKGRLYIPREALKQFGLKEEELFVNKGANYKKELIRYLIHRTKVLMKKGYGIWNQLPVRLRYELQLTFWGGMRILDKTAKMGDKVFEKRPVLNSWDWCYNFLRLG